MFVCYSCSFLLPVCPSPHSAPAYFLSLWPTGLQSIFSTFPKSRISVSACWRVRWMELLNHLIRRVLHLLRSYYLCISQSTSSGSGSPRNCWCSGCTIHTSSPWEYILFACCAHSRKGKLGTCYGHRETKYREHEVGPSFRNMNYMRCFQIASRTFTAHCYWPCQARLTF